MLFRSLTGDRRSRPQRNAEVAAQHPGKEGRVLLEERPIQAEPAAQLFDILLGGRFAEHRLRRIAGNEMNQREDEGGDAQKYRNRQQEPTREEPEHGVILGYPRARMDLQSRRQTADTSERWRNVTFARMTFRPAGNNALRV